MDNFRAVRLANKEATSLRVCYKIPRSEIDIWMLRNALLDTNLQVPKMKVFTVGMDEKPPLKDNPATADGVSLASTPVITLEKKRSSYKVSWGFLLCLTTLTTPHNLYSTYFI